MKFLSALLAQLSIGLIYRLGVPVLCAIIVEHYITHPQIEDGFTRYPHPATFVISGLFSALCGALITATEASAKDPTFSITTRTCACVAAWSFIRLAMRQEQLTDAAPFYAIAFCLLVATVVSLITLPDRSRVGGYVLYGTAAAVVLFFGVYASGRKVLVLNRHSGAVTATLDTYRWLGSRRVTHRSAGAVTGVVHAYQSQQFAEAGEGVVVQGEERELLLQYDDNVERTIRRFLGSTESSLVLAEPTLSRWRLSGLWLIASTVLLVGLSCDPVVRQPVTRLARQTARVIAVNFGVAVGIFALLGMGTVWQWKSTRSAARLNIESLGCAVEDADLEARGTPLLGSAWSVKATDPSFDDERLRELAPHLKHAPGLSLNLSNTRVTNAGLQHLSDVDLLVTLDLRGTAVTGAALPAIDKMDVRYLDVRDTQIRAADIQSAGFSHLEYLLFEDPEFSRKSVNSLLNIKRLKYVYIDKARLTPDDLKFWESEIDFEIEFPDDRAEKVPD